MKVDPSGEFLFLVTDSITGKPLKDQEILIRRNITRTYTEYLDTTTNQRVRADAPPLAQAFSTGKILGNTDADGFLRVHLDRLEGIAYAADPYSLTFENGGEYE